MRTILIVNKSTLVSKDQVAAWVAAIQIQVTRDLARFWAEAAGVTLQLADSAADAEESIDVVDVCDVQGALGYHFVDGVFVPKGICAVKTTLDAGDQPSATLSHEVLEQIVDPSCADTMFAQWKRRPAVLPKEVCDAVENDEYVINGVQVSNFVLPAWYVPGEPASTQFDFLGLAKAPLTLRPGGYTEYTTDLKRWAQQFGSAAKKYQRTVMPGSRRHRRAMLRDRKAAKRPKLAAANGAVE